jgi:uncharacterized protein YkwD
VHVRSEVDAQPVKAGLVRPSLVLALLAAVAAVAMALPVAASPARARVSSSLAALDVGVLHQLNAIRALHGLAPVKETAALDSSAAQHSREMAARGYFKHNSADGTVFWKRIAHWYGSSHYGYWSVGENLLWSSPDVGAPEAMRMWMNSPEHRANILNPRWREIGIAAVHAAAAPGMYHGMAVTIVTTDFGFRR